MCDGSVFGRKESLSPQELKMVLLEIKEILDEEVEACVRCGKKESECDVYDQGNNLSTYAPTGELLCPDCIPCDDEDE